MSRPRYARGLVLSALAALLSCGGGGANVDPKPTATRAVPPPVPAVRDDGRLPALAKPLRYDLAFEIDPNTTTFRGSSQIDVEVLEPTSWIVLHGEALTLTRAEIVVGDRTLPAHASFRPSHEAHVADELALGFDEPLPRGNARLVFAWEGTFGDDLSGLYRVKDGDAYYAFTQFESTDARRAFPCFDEPAFKTPFDVHVTAPAGLLAVSNAPEGSHEQSPERPGTTTFHFARTQPLPTYLVALAVGTFDVAPLGRASSVPIRLLTTKGKQALGSLALDATADLIAALAKWFQIPYPFDKLDIVAVPEFAAGAMENAGLVTFRDELLLLDPARASIRARRSQALTIAHELAHQWFGNLVTASWWDDLWLNEGFATWMERRIVDRWQPAFEERYEAALDVQYVMDTDALATARAVRQPVTSTSQAREAFDGLTYGKGAAVLDTIERWVGEETFRRGVQTYLRENAGKSVHADALFSVLDRVSNKDVTSMASSFVDFTGVPEVSLELACERGNRWHAEVVQEAWRPIGSKAEEPPNRAWTLPVCMATATDAKTVCSELVAGAPAMMSGTGCPAWVHPNTASSYYRFSLADKQWDALARAKGKLDVPARVALLANAWAQVRAGRLDAEAILRILPTLDDDTSRQVSQLSQGILSSMNDVLIEDAARPAFRRFVAARFAKKKKELGWAPKTNAAPNDDEMLLRRDVVWAMGELAEDEDTLREAEGIASKWLHDPASVDADMAGVALGLASRHAGSARLEELWATAKKAKTREDRLTALKATMGFDDVALLTRALDAALTDDVRAAEIGYLLRAGVGRRAARYPTEAWIRAHWDALRRKLPGALGAGLVRAAGVACTPKEVEDRAAFYGPRAKEIEGAPRPLMESLEAAGLCAELRAHSAKKLTRAMLNRKGS